MVSWSIRVTLIESPVTPCCPLHFVLCLLLTKQYQFGTN